MVRTDTASATSHVLTEWDYLFDTGHGILIHLRGFALISILDGVTTNDNGRVIWLQTVVGLSGEIPPELADLGALEVLSLQGDGLSGEIHVWATFPT